MTVLDASEKIAPNTEVGHKDPFTRLLDLILGWGEYVEKDEAAHPDGVQSADIYEAYQAVAAFAEPYWDAAPEVQEMAVRHFVDTRLLPLLIGTQSLNPLLSEGEGGGLLPGEASGRTHRSVSGVKSTPGL